MISFASLVVAMLSFHKRK
ncbi:hypothetical protein [Paenibacillus cellulosilyticus]